VLAGAFLIKFHLVTAKVDIAYLRFYTSGWVECSRLVVRILTWGVEQWISPPYAAHLGLIQLQKNQSAWS